jgi:hypothetical protein
LRVVRWAIEDAAVRLARDPRTDLRPQVISELSLAAVAAAKENRREEEN